MIEERDVDKFFQQIGNKIATLRGANGLSRKHIGGVIGVSGQQLAKYENGSNRIDLFRLKVIAKFFEKDLRYFYESPADSDYQGIVADPSQWYLEVVQNLMKITDHKQQSAISEVVRALTERR